MSAYDLLVPSSVIILPILSYAVLVEQQWGSCLVDPPAGIYKTNSLDPIIPSGSQLFYRSDETMGNYPLLPLTDFDNYNGDVYNNKGRLVLTAMTMRNKDTCLLPKPMIPVSALRIVKLLAENYIVTKQPHIKHNPYGKQIDKLIKPGFEYLLDEGYLDSTCVGLISQIETFIGRDINHLYFTKLKLLDIVVEKTIDYRIFEWELLQDSYRKDGINNEFNSNI
jgi:hypothetical protein